MKVFNEDIDIFNTTKEYNILSVKEFEESFLDIFQITINENQYLASKIGEFMGCPIAEIPIKLEDGEYEAPFLLVKGNQGVTFNESNTKIPIEILPAQEFKEIPDEIKNNPVVIVEKYIESPSSLIRKEIEEATLNSLKLQKSVKLQKIKESKRKEENNKAEILSFVENTKSNLVEDFLEISEKIKCELFSLSKDQQFELEKIIENTANRLLLDATKSLDIKLEDSTTQLEQSVKDLAYHVYTNILAEKIEGDVADEVAGGFKLVETRLESILKEKVNNKELKALQEKLENKLDTYSNEISLNFDNKIKLLENKSIELDAVSRKHLIDFVNESKSNLILEIRKLKNEKPVEYVIESNHISEKKSFDLIEKDWDKKISDKISNVEINLRKYVAAYGGGGGTVAMQFANGGTMNGDLTIVGSISALNYLGLTGDYLPLSGGTINGDLIVTGSTTTDNITFDQTPELAGGVGVLKWNDVDGTLDLGLKGGNVTLQIGQEFVARVVNKTNENLLESQYKVVRIRGVSEGGTQGGRLAVILAKADTDPNSVTTLGIVTENINKNQEGFITTQGHVREINTTGSIQNETWVDGDVLYLSPTIAGRLTNVEPQAPQHTVTIGYVEYAHAQHGRIFVKIDNGYELEELHNVKITSPTNNDVLTYNSLSGIWVNKTNSTNYLPLSGGTISGDIEITNSAKGIILKSPNGTSHRIIVNNDGTLASTIVYI